MGCGASVSPPGGQQPGNPINSTGRPKHTFSDTHGYNVQLSNNSRTATRLPGCYDNAVVITQRPLEDGELLEVTLDKAGSSFGTLEAGVTSVSPGELSLPASLTELQAPAWVLWNNSLVLTQHKGQANSYPLYLDCLTPGTRIGLSIQRFKSRSLHFHKNGEDMGEAFTDLPDNVYPIINLHGYVEQVSLTGKT